MGSQSVVPAPAALPRKLLEMHISSPTPNSPSRSSGAVASKPLISPPGDSHAQLLENQSLYHTALPWNSHRRRSSVLPKWFPSFPTNFTFHCVTLPSIIPSTPLSQPTASPLIPTPAGESRHAAATHWRQEPVFRSNKGLM